MAQHPRIGLTIFDPLRKMFRGVPENDNSAMSEAMSYAGRIARMCKVASAISHHTPKNATRQREYDPDNPDLAVGAGAIGSSSRLVINVLPQSELDKAIQGTRENMFSVRVVKNNYGPIGQPTWWERKGLLAVNGQEYPTPWPVDIRSIHAATDASYIYTIGDYMLAHSRNQLSVTQAAIVILDQLPIAGNRTPRAMAETLRLLFRRGHITHPYTNILTGETYTLVLNAEQDKGHHFTLHETRMQAPAAPIPLKVLGGFNDVP